VIWQPLTTVHDLRRRLKTEHFRSPNIAVLCSQTEQWLKDILASGLREGKFMRSLINWLGLSEQVWEHLRAFESISHPPTSSGLWRPIMKFFQGLCETITQALGLSAFSSWDQDTSLRQPLGHPYHAVKPIQGKETLRYEPPQTHAIQALETLFPPNPSGASSDQDDSFNQREQEISLQNQKLPVGKSPDSKLPPGPIFSPPNARTGFMCDYSAMRGWRHTAGNNMRANWLEKPIMDSDTTGGIYNIFTNYDQYAPIGTLRKVRLLSMAPSVHV